jgi:hypothetical protein
MLDSYAQCASLLGRIIPFAGIIPISYRLTDVSYLPAVLIHSVSLEAIKAHLKTLGVKFAISNA